MIFKPIRDKKAVCDDVNKYGKEYKYRVMELIEICRGFSIDPQSPGQVVELQNVLEACEPALKRAHDSRGKIREHANQEIDNATRGLHSYEKKYYPKRAVEKTVNARMKAATDKDEKKKNKGEELIKHRDPSLKVVKFRIPRSPSNNGPIIVEQLVNDTLKLPYILWNFVNYNGIERLTLADNPQFYGDLPASLTEYQSTCNILPVDIPGNFPDTNRMIHVLTNNANRVVLDHGKNWRTFDNVWRANDNTLILKNVTGNIQGDHTVDDYVPASPLDRLFMRHDDFQLFENIVDWKAPVRDLPDSQYTRRIHIRINHES